MNGPIAQIVALACHGNASLRGVAKGTQFFPDNSTCQFCDRVDFVELRRGLLGRRLKENCVADTPDDWFRLLREQGSTGLWLDYSASGDRLDDRLSAGFVGGGGHWSINVFSDTASRWLARWEVWNQDAPERRIWRVTYGRVEQGRRVQSHDSLDLGLASERLEEALGQIAPFARRRNCDGFAECFDSAHGILTASAECEVYHRDLAPEGVLTPAADRILAACQKAWVFGGMGSWNDMMFDGEEQDEYERVSDLLFKATTSAIVAAANSSLE